MAARLKIGHLVMFRGQGSRREGETYIASRRTPLEVAMEVRRLACRKCGYRHIGRFCGNCGKPTTRMTGAAHAQ
jgi:rubrerythrin